MVKIDSRWDFPEVYSLISRTLDSHANSIERHENDLEHFTEVVNDNADAFNELLEWSDKIDEWKDGIDNDISEGAELLIETINVVTELNERVYRWILVSSAQNERLTALEQKVDAFLAGFDSEPQTGNSTGPHLSLDVTSKSVLEPDTSVAEYNEAFDDEPIKTCPPVFNFFDPAPARTFEVDTEGMIDTKAAAKAIREQIQESWTHKN